MMDISLNHQGHFSTCENLRLKAFVREIASNFRVAKCFENFIPLTLPFKNSQGQQIQLWKIKDYGLMGTVLDLNVHDISFIPKFRIRSAVSALEGDALMERLEMGFLKRWDLVYKTHEKAILVWPHLDAAGRLGRHMPNGEFKHGDGLDGHRTKIFKLDSLADAKRVSEGGEPMLWQFKKKGGEKYNHKAGQPINHVGKIEEVQAGLQNVIHDERKKLSKRNLSDQKRKESEARLGEACQLLAYTRRYVPYKAEILLQQNQKEPPSFGKDPQNEGKNSPLMPGKGQFYEVLEKTGLTKSYNSCHPDHPAPKGSGGGEIGGVGGTVELIEGLFDSPESLFEKEHCFFLPAFQGESAPFSSEEMCQILHELTRGIYLHGTVPFFSLHFNQEANLYPVIHPAYENTLVGQVFSMLDYFMKGYLNGGVFKESFIQKWQENPYKIDLDDTVLEELINFKSYAESSLSGEDKKYLSTRTFLKLLELSSLEKVGQAVEEVVREVFNKNYQKENPIFNDYTKFSNSFRIIAKQQGIHKAENLFVVDADFDVLYTIEPDPDYKQCLEEHYKLHGSYPQAYLNLLSAYELIKKNIHDHMVKMPFCRKYFAMLGVINFFSYYLMTLKKHRKFPILPSFNPKAAQCPSLFPPLPILNTREEELNINILSVIKNLISQYKPDLKRYLLDNENQGEISQLKEALEKLCWIELNKNISAPLRRELLLNDRGSKQICKQVVEKILTTIKVLFDKLSTSPSRDMRISLADLVGICIQHISQIFPDKLQTVASITLELFILPSEQNPKERELNKKIVGGCGMNVSSHKLQLSPIAHGLLDHAWSDIKKTPFGEWSPVFSEDPTIPKGVIFKLPFIDLPFGCIEDSQRMESLLSNSQDSFFTYQMEMQSIIKSMAQGDRVEFQTLIDSSPHPIDKMIDFEGRSLLHHSVEVDDLFFISHLLEKEELVTQGDQKHYLPIHYAAMLGRIPHLKFLISKSQKTIQATSNQGATPLIVAIQHHQSQVVEYLLANGSAGNERLKDGYTALHCAVLAGDLEIIKCLLEHSKLALETINSVTNEGVSPLMIACRRVSISLVSYLLKMGANPQIKAKNGVSPLEIVVKKNQLELCQLLAPQSTLSATIIETAIKKSSIEINQLLADLPGYLTYQNAIQDTPLLIAIRYANLPVAMYILNLIQNVEQINVKNRLKEYPVTLAIQGKFYSLLEALLKKGAEISPINLFKLLLKNGYQGDCPFLDQYLNHPLSSNQLNDLLLMAAKVGNHVAISKLLLPKKADLSKVEGDKGWKIEHYLAKSDGIYLFKMRYQQTQDPLQPLREENGKTLAYIAGENGSWRVFEFLLDELIKRKVSLENHYGGKHLFSSVLERGDLEGIRLFVKKVNDQQLINHSLDDKGAFPVHLAAKYCSRNVLEYLYQHGADLNKKDPQGHFPLFYALQRREEHVIEFLIDEKHQNPITTDSIYLTASFKKDTYFKLLMRAGADLNNCQNFEGDSPLIFAIKQHHQRAFVRLIQHGASLSHSNKDGWTPLLCASHEGQSEMLEFILERNPKCWKEKIKGNNALHLACQRGHVDCAKLLIERGFSIKEANGLGQTALSLAKNHNELKASLQVKSYKTLYDAQFSAIETAINNQDLSSILNKSDLSFNTYFTIYPLRGTILHLLLSLYRSHVGIEELMEKILKTNDFDPTLRDSRERTYSHLMVMNQIDPVQFGLFDLEAVDQNGKTPLHYASVERESKCLMSLIKKLGPQKIDPIDHRGRTPLFGAIEMDRRENVKLLIKEGANLEHCDHYGLTPLILACQKGNYPIIRILIKFGANINQRGGREGITPLGVALSSKHEEVPLFLLFSGAKLNSVNFGGELIGHLAASRNKIYILRFLAEQGLSLSSPNQVGAQPIHTAAIRGKVQALEFLTQQGILIETPVKTSSDHKDGQVMDGLTPILLASREGTVKAVKWLLDHGADPERQTERGWNILQNAMLNTSINSQEIIQLFKEYLFINDLNQILPAITLAIVRDFVEPLKLLYGLGVPVYSKLEHGLTGLHYACQFGSLQATEFLLTHGSDWEIPAESGQLPIEFAAVNQSAEQFQLMLIYTQPPLDRQNAKGETLIHLATQAGNLAHVMILIEQNADFDLQDSQGRSPLHIAAEREFKEIITLLMICGADPDLKTIFNARLAEDFANSEIKALITKLRSFIKKAPEKSTPLHIAAKLGDSLSVQLTARFFDPNQKNVLGRTPLHEAIDSASLRNIRELLNQGAEINQQDREGNTPLTIACLKSPNRRVAKFLVRAGAIPQSEEERNFLNNHESFAL